MIWISSPDTHSFSSFPSRLFMESTAPEISSPVIRSVFRIRTSVSLFFRSARIIFPFSPMETDTRPDKNSVPSLKTTISSRVYASPFAKSSSPCPFSSFTISWVSPPPSVFQVSSTVCPCPQNTYRVPTGTLLRLSRIRSRFSSERQIVSLSKSMLLPSEKLIASSQVRTAPVFSCSTASLKAVSSPVMGAVRISFPSLFKVIHPPWTLRPLTRIDPILSFSASYRIWIRLDAPDISAMLRPSADTVNITGSAAEYPSGASSSTRKYVLPPDNFPDTRWGSGPEIHVSSGSPQGCIFPFSAFAL